MKFCALHKVKLSVPPTPTGTSLAEGILHAPQVRLSCRKAHLVEKKHRLSCRQTVFLFWSRVRESNPPSRLGKPLYYRYTNPAFGSCIGIIAKAKGKSNLFLSRNSTQFADPGKDLPVSLRAAKSGVAISKCCLPKSVYPKGTVTFRPGQGISTCFTNISIPIQKCALQALQRALVKIKYLPASADQAPWIPNPAP